eukprot:COSAG05_NODE_193_length_14574_cov_23.070812_13_plen_165_part_00
METRLYLRACSGVTATLADVAVNRNLTPQKRASVTRFKLCFEAGLGVALGDLHRVGFLDHGSEVGGLRKEDSEFLWDPVDVLPVKILDELRVRRVQFVAGRDVEDAVGRHARFLNAMENVEARRLNLGRRGRADGHAGRPVERADAPRDPRVRRQLFRRRVVRV